MLAETSSTPLGMILLAAVLISAFTRFTPYILGAFILLILLGSYFPNDPSVAKAQVGVSNLLGTAFVFWFIWIGIRLIFTGRVKRGPSSRRD
jgi:hypothetical protein